MNSIQNEEFRRHIRLTANAIGENANHHSIYDALTDDFIMEYGGKFNIIVGICQMIRKNQVKIKTERVKHQRHHR